MYCEEKFREKEEGVTSGYFVRSLPGTKEVMPVQACMFISDTDVMQTAHNIVIAEENSELHLITGCATGDDISSAMHVGVSEMYLKPGSATSSYCSGISFAIIVVYASSILPFIVTSALKLVVVSLM